MVWVQLFWADLIHIKNIPNLRDQSKALQPKTRTDKFGLNSFRYEAAYIWNNLPSDYKICEDFSKFQVCFDKWTGPACNCVIAYYAHYPGCDYLHITHITSSVFVQLIV